MNATETIPADSDELLAVIADYGYDEYCAMVPPGAVALDQPRFQWTKLRLRQVIAERRTLAARQAELEHLLLLA